MKPADWYIFPRKMPLIGGHPGNSIHGPRMTKATARRARIAAMPPRRKVLIGGPGNSIHGPKQLSRLERIARFQNRNLIRAGIGGGVVFGAYELAKHHSSGRNGVQPQSSGGYSGM